MNEYVIALLFRKEPISSILCFVLLQFRQNKGLLLVAQTVENLLGMWVGASAVWEDDELPSSFARAAIYGAVLIEELVTGKRELEVGILSHKGRHTVSPAGEVLCHGFYDYDKKYGGATGTVCPADIDDRTAEKIKKYALTLTDAIDIRGTARIDFFLSGDRLLFNEINTMPGFTRDSLYPELMRAAGIPTARLFDLLIGDAIG